MKLTEYIYEIKIFHTMKCDIKIKNFNELIAKEFST